jgi:predicted DNA-binding ribbon-helix-helix protein
MRRNADLRNPVLRDALDDIAKRQGKQVRQVLSEIELGRDSRPLATAIRVYIVDFYRSALGRAETHLPKVVGPPAIRP